MAGALKRRLGPGLLTAYGVGVIVGAGIYVLIGAVVGHAGPWAPLAFLLAGLVALPSALTFAEFSTRMPEAAGAAAFVGTGFGARKLGVAVGLAMVVAAVISGAAVLRGGAGYLASLVPVQEAWLIVALGAALVLIAVAGVIESMAFAAALTAIEVAGLLLVAWAGLSAAPVAAWQAPAEADWVGIGAAVSLCFFAFIGFDNIANMAEETREPARVLPRAILAALAVTATLYVLVAWAAVRAVEQADMSTSAQPLTLLWERATGRGGAFLSAIAVAAAANGVLAQVVMAARVLYGLGRRSAWLSRMHRAHPRLGTPVEATLLVGATLIAAALAAPVEALAEATSAVLLVVFALVNLALIRLKARQPDAAFRVPVLVPVTGLATALMALAALIWSAA